jgi:hypothetical protein
MTDCLTLLIFFNKKRVIICLHSQTVDSKHFRVLVSIYYDTTKLDPEGKFEL